MRQYQYENTFIRLPCVERLESAERLLQATDACMGDMYDIARRIRDFTDAEPDVTRKGHFLIDFMKAFRPGNKKKKGSSGGMCT